MGKAIQVVSIVGAGVLIGGRARFRDQVIAPRPDTLEGRGAQIEGVLFFVEAGVGGKDVLRDAPEPPSNPIKLRPCVLEAETQARMNILVEVLKQVPACFLDASSDLLVQLLLQLLERR